MYLQKFKIVASIPQPLTVRMFTTDFFLKHSNVISLWKGNKRIGSDKRHGVGGMGAVNVQQYLLFRKNKHRKEWKRTFGWHGDVSMSIAISHARTRNSLLWSLNINYAKHVVNYSAWKLHAVWGRNSLLFNFFFFLYVVSTSCNFSLRRCVNVSQR